MRRPGARCRGFSLLELVVALIVLFALVGVFLGRASFYAEQAERAAVEHTVATLRAAMPIRIEQLRRERGARALAALAEENPLDWLSAKPENYLGEFYSPELEKMPEGNWVFDRRDKCLIYLLKSHKSFALGSSIFLKFKVEFKHLPSAAGPRREQSGVAFSQVSEGL